MASKTALRKTIREIENALKLFVEDHGPHHIYVFESSSPYLRALVVSDMFEKWEVATRQNKLWDHLGKTVTADTLNTLWGVHPYTWKEYDEDFEQSSSSPDPHEVSDKD